MHKGHEGHIKVFDELFEATSSMHNYNTKFASKSTFSIQNNWYELRKIKILDIFVPRFGMISRSLTRS